MNDERLRANLVRHLACGNEVLLDDLARRISFRSGEELVGYKLVERVLEFFPGIPIGRVGSSWDNKFVVKKRMPECKHARCLQRKIDAAHSL